MSLGSSVLFVLLFEGVLRWARFLPFALRVATGWVLFEWVHSWFLGGFPWLFLSHSQYAYLPVIQAADIVGAAGISFVMAYAGGALWQPGDARHFTTLKFASQERFDQKVRSFRLQGFTAVHVSLVAFGQSAEVKES